MRSRYAQLPLNLFTSNKQYQNFTIENLPKNFHTRKLGEISLFYAVVLNERNLKCCKYFTVMAADKYMFEVDSQEPRKIY